MAWPSVSARTKDWGTETLTDTDLESELDLLHDWLNDAFSSSTGHKHDGTTSEGPKILTANIDDSAGSQGDVFYSSGTAITRLAAGTSGKFLKTQGAGANPIWDTVNADQSQDGSTVQVVNSTTSTYSTGTTAIPYDNTIPQNTEGDQFLSLAITPGSTTNILKIDVHVHGGSNTAQAMAVALFQDSTANALAVGFGYTGVNEAESVSFTHYMVAGTTSATTFKVRCGGASGTFYFNGANAGSKYGGVSSSSITITEFKGS